MLLFLKIKIMKNISVLLILLTVTFTVFAQQNQSSFEKYLDTKNYSADSEIKNVNIEGIVYNIKIVRDVFNKYNKPYYDKNDEMREESKLEAPITLLFLNSQNKIVDAIRFESEMMPITYKLFKNNKNLSDKDKLYLTVNHSGTSSSIDKVYLISLNKNNIEKTLIVEYCPERALIVFNKNKEEILALKAFKSEDDQGRFNEQRVAVSKITYNNGKYVETILSTSKNKYIISKGTISKSINEILDKEPNLFKNILIKEYL